jgi:outer membrane protein assembly factor BamB
MTQILPVAHYILSPADVTTIYAIDTTTHQSVWSIPTSGFLALSENGVLFVVESINSATTGKIYAINVK